MCAWVLMEGVRWHAQGVCRACVVRAQGVCGREEREGAPAVSVGRAWGAGWACGGAGRGREAVAVAWGAGA